MRRVAAVAAVALGTLVFPVQRACAADEASVTHLVPSGAQRGKSVEVVLQGTLNGGDQRRSWASHPGLAVAFGKKDDRVTVTVKPDVAPGRYWLRFANSGAASSLLPFVVSGIAEVAEKEPNGRLEDAQKLGGPSQIVNGVLSESRDVDVFGVSMKSGQSLVVSMTAHTELGSPMDSLLQVVTSRGFVVAQDDDSLGLDPFVVFTARRDGTYYVRTFAFPVKTNSTIGLASGKDFVYRMMITTGAYVDFTMPAAISAKAPSKLEVRGWNLPQPAVPWTIEPGDGGVGGRFFRAGSANTVSLKRVEHAVVVEVEPNGRAKPQAVVVPLTVSGRIAQDKDRDVYEFEASKGKALRLSVESRRLGFPLDPVLRVTDSKGKTLNETDSRSADKVDEAISWTPPSDGRFRVEVRDLFEHGGERFVYRLTIEPQPVTVTATVEKDVWTLVGEKPLEIKVTLSRIGGFDKAVRFELAECPEGVMVEPVTSEPKGDSAKAITLKLTQKPGAKLGGGRLRIVGRVEGVAEAVALATAPIARLKDRTEHLWLVVKPAEKKKDKKK
jgi:hypothetical protein